ncbi:hypothetical protein D3C73_1041950 [compost metagenome]
MTSLRRITLIMEFTVENIAKLPGPECQRLLLLKIQIPDHFPGLLQAYRPKGRVRRAPKCLRLARLLIKNPVRLVPHHLFPGKIFMQILPILRLEASNR